MGKTNKVSISAMDKIVKDMYSPVAVVDWRGVEVSVKNTISLKEMLEFVNDVVASCFDETGNYMPEIRDFATKSALINKYTNISLPDKVEHSYDIIYKTDVIKMITENINGIQFNTILDSIDAKIEHLAQASIEAATKQVAELYTSLDSLLNRIDSGLAEISSEDIQNFISAFNNGGMDEEKIVSAVLKHQLKKDKGSISES